MAKLPFKKGGRGGASAVTPANVSANAIKRALTFNLPLGTGAVTTATHALGHMPVAGKVLAIYVSAGAAVTGTSLTLAVNKQSTDGNTATSLQSAAQDIKITSSTDNTVLAPALTSTTADLSLTAGQLLTATATATSITAGPGNVAITVVFVPSEDSLTANGLVTTGADL